MTAMTWIWHTSQTTSSLWVPLPKGGEVITVLSCVTSLISPSMHTIDRHNTLNICRWHVNETSVNVQES